MEHFARNVTGMLNKFRVKTFRGGLLVFPPQYFNFPFVTTDMKVKI